MRAICAMGLAVFLLAGAAPGDIIYLADGTSHEGHLLSESETGYDFEVAQGKLRARLTIKRQDVARLERGESANDRLLAECERRRKELREADPRGWLDFAEWLSGHPGFAAEARVAYERVLALEADNELARRKLGYQKVGAAWLTEEEIMLSKGLLRYGNRWVTVEERERLLALEAERQRELVAEALRRAELSLAGEEARRRATEEGYRREVLQEYYGNSLLSRLGYYRYLPAAPYGLELGTSYSSSSGFFPFTGWSSTQGPSTTTTGTFGVLIEGQRGNTHYRITWGFP